MKSSRSHKDKNIEINVIKDIRNHSKLKKLKSKTNDAATKGIRNLFRLKKKIKQLNTKCLEILQINLSMKKEIIN